MPPMGDLLSTLEKYLPQGTEVHLTRLREYKGRTAAIDEVLAYAEKVGVRRQVRSAIGQVCEEWLEDKRVVGITSGASAPEELVQGVIEFFRARGTEEIEELEVVREDVRFMLPKPIRALPS